MKEKIDEEEETHVIWMLPIELLDFSDSGLFELPLPAVSHNMER